MFKPSLNLTTCNHAPSEKIWVLPTQCWCEFFVLAVFVVLTNLCDILIIDNNNSMISLGWMLQQPWFLFLWGIWRSQWGWRHSYCLSFYFCCCNCRHWSGNECNIIVISVNGYYLRQLLNKKLFSSFDFITKFTVSFLI